MMASDRQEAIGMGHEVKKGDRVRMGGESWIVDTVYAGGGLLLKHARIKSIMVGSNVSEVTPAAKRATPAQEPEQGQGATP